MFKRPFFIIVPTLFLFFGCESNESTTTNESNTNSVGSNSPNENDSIVPEIKLEIVGVKSAQFERYLDENVTLKITLEIKNSTKSKITTCNIKGYIKTVYNNENIVFLPSNGAVDSEDSYIAKKFSGVDGKVDEDVSIKSPWNPGESRLYKFSIPGWADINNFELVTSVFERTPEVAEVHFFYNAISIDDEYHDLVYFDILDLWKGFQKELGLR